MTNIRAIRVGFRAAKAIIHRDLIRTAAKRIHDAVPESTGHAAFNTGGP